MTDDRLVGATAARRPLALLRLASVTLLTKAELDGVEANLVLLQNFDHRVGSCLHDGARNLLSLFIEDLGHPQLSTDNADH